MAGKFLSAMGGSQDALFNHEAEVRAHRGWSSSSRRALGAILGLRLSEPACVSHLFQDSRRGEKQEGDDSDH